MVPLSHHLRPLSVGLGLGDEESMRFSRIALNTLLAAACFGSSHTEGLKDQNFRKATTEKKAVICLPKIRVQSRVSFSMLFRYSMNRSAGLNQHQIAILVRARMNRRRREKELEWQAGIWVCA